jgi:hypothetical protein
MAHPSVFWWYWNINGDMNRCGIPKGLNGFSQIMKKQPNFIVWKNNEDAGNQIVHKFLI